jgi:hypothetical protein
MSYSFDEVLAFEVGKIYYECEMGLNIEARVASVPVLGKDRDGRRQASWTAVNTQNNQPIISMTIEGLMHYGPRMYSSPQFFTMVDGKCVFPLLGAEEVQPR